MAQTFDVPLISYGIVSRREPSIIDIKFDDAGYRLRMHKGMNADPQIWEIPYNAIPISRANDIENFLADHGGVRWFWWRPPRQFAQRKFICRRWTREPVAGSRSHDKMTMTFEEVFDLVG